LRVLCQKLAHAKAGHNFVLISAGIGAALLFAPSLQKNLSAKELNLVKGETAEVAQVIDGDTVKLKRAVGTGNLVSDQIRLVGIQAPKLPLGRKNFKTWPLAEVAKRALEKLSLGKKVTLSYGGRRMDRHGRLLAHLHLPDGAWLQGALLAQGMARVYSFPDNRAVVTEMLLKEQAARSDKIGIWRHPFYRIHQQTELVIDLKRLKNSFQLIEGQVLDVTRLRKKVFINFGPNWRTDFTVSLNARAAKLFDRAGFDPLLLKGKRIRVRGWIKSFNGPMINATHPEQLEMLDR